MVAQAQRLAAKISPEEWKVRVDLAAAYRLVHLFGWDDLTGTHISARVPGPEDHFLINPFGVLFDQITASSLIKIDCDGNKLSDSEYGVNRAGFVIHSAIHMSRPDLTCVLHTHTPAGVGVATQRDGLLPLSQHSLVVLSHAAYHDYQGVATNLAERESLVRDLGDKSILILRNHGLLTVGRTIGEAWMFMYRAERACRMQLAFQSAGAPAYPIPAEVQELAISQGRQTRFLADGASVEWRSLLRRVDQADPSYRD